MELNSGFITCKKTSLSFIKKGVICWFLFLLIILFAVFAFFVFNPEKNAPISVKIILVILLSIFLLGFIIVSLNGMYMNKKGRIIFIPDVRLKKIKLIDLKRISINFNQWENNKFSVMIKFVYKDGKSFKKDYSNQFTGIRNKRLAMSLYTISKRRVDKICESLNDLKICVITIIDKNSKVIYQTTNEDRTENSLPY